MHIIPPCCLETWLFISGKTSRLTLVTARTILSGLSDRKRNPFTKTKVHFVWILFPIGNKQSCCTTRRCPTVGDRARSTTPPAHPPTPPAAVGVSRVPLIGKHPPRRQANRPPVVNILQLELCNRNLLSLHWLNIIDASSLLGC